MLGGLGLTGQGAHAPATQGPALRERMSLPATNCAIVGRLKDPKFKGLSSESKALTKLRAMSTLSSRKTVSSRAASSVSSFFFFRWAAWYSRCRCLRSASERFDPRTSSGGGAAAPTVGASEPKVAAIRHKRDPMRNHNAVPVSCEISHETIVVTTIGPRKSTLKENHRAHKASGLP